MALTFPPSSTVVPVLCLGVDCSLDKEFDIKMEQFSIESQK